MEVANLVNPFKWITNKWLLIIEQYAQEINEKYGQKVEYK